jgi:urease accessory protein
MAFEAQEAIFAANRAVGRIALTVKAVAGVTRRARLHEQGALRLRCPGPSARELEAVIVNTAGGIAGGDRFGVDVTVESGAQLVVTTAAAEKLYRSAGAATAIDVRLAVAAGGELAWLPQETILFDRARLRRTIEVDLADDARLVLAEASIFGRSGMGEQMRDGLLFDRWRIRRNGRLAYADTVRLDGAIAAKLGGRAVANAGIAIATVLVLPGTDETVAGVRALGATYRGEVGASAWNGLAAIRFVAPDGAALRHDLICALTVIRGTALPRLWLN